MKRDCFYTEQGYPTTLLDKENQMSTFSYLLLVQKQDDTGRFSLQIFDSLDVSQSRAKAGSESTSLKERTMASLSALERSILWNHSKKAIVPQVNGATIPRIPRLFLPIVDSHRSGSKTEMRSGWMD